MEFAGPPPTATNTPWSWLNATAAPWSNMEVPSPVQSTPFWDVAIEFVPIPPTETHVFVVGPVVEEKTNGQRQTRKGSIQPVLVGVRTAPSPEWVVEIHN
jgi:hypothetical protein